MTPAEKVNNPAMALMAAGGVLVLYNLVYALWTLISMLLTVAQMGSGAMWMLDADVATILTVLGPSLWVLVMKLITGLVHLVLLLPSVLVIRSGLRFKDLIDLDGTRRGAILSIVTPLIALVLGTILVLLSFSCCGLVSQTLPTLLVTLLGAGAGAFTLQTLGDEEVAAAFTDPE